jgi:hypothetical protein
VLWHLLDQDYRVIQASAYYYFISEGHSDELRSLPTLRGSVRLYQEAARPKGQDAESAIEGDEADEPPATGDSAPAPAPTPAA